MRAALLARVSTTGQADADRHSLPMQTRLMAEFCERQGWEVVHVYEIPGESAYTDNLAKRPQFAAAIMGAERGEYDALVVYDVSRFARDQFMLHDSLRRLRAAGVQMVGINGIDYANDPLRAGIEGAFAEQQSRDHSRRIRDAIERRHQMGLPTGDIPFGYRRSPSTDQPPTLIPEEAEAVRWAFQQYGSGTGYDAIASEFNRRGLKPRSKHKYAPGVFAASSIQTIIESRFYAGFVTHRGHEAPGAHEPVINEAEWSAANGRIRHRHKRQRVNEALLVGLTRCSRCLGPVWVNSAGQRRHGYYAEAARKRRRECPVAGRRMRIDHVDPLVEQAVTTMTLKGEWMEYVQHHARTVSSGVSHAAERSRLMDMRRRINRIYQAGGMTDSEWESELAGIDRHIVALPPDEPTQILAAGELFTDMLEPWEVLTPQERNALCRALFDDVMMDCEEQAVWLRPKPNYEHLFRARLDYVMTVGESTPARTRTLVLPHPRAVPLEVLAS